MVKSLKEMSHILGLENNPFFSVGDNPHLTGNEGWFRTPAVDSIRQRYKRLNADLKSNINFEYLSSSWRTTIPTKIADLSHGGYIGLSAGWTGHAYTLHAVKEGNRTHFIYVNRGQRHYNLNPDKPKNYQDPINTVLVFSIENEKAKNFAREMIGAANSANRRMEVSKFLHRHKAKVNHTLSQVLRKKNQKVGNCTVANSNIAWHFQLASDYMKKHHTSFEVAYNQTKEVYRDMRVQDRIEAFHYLLKHKHAYSEQAYFYNYMLVVNKLVGKDHLDKGRYIETLLNSTDAETLKKFIKPLISTSYEQLAYESINKKTYKVIDNFRKSKDTVLMQVFNKLPEKPQKDLISNNISLLKYSSMEIQKAYLMQDYNKFSLYACAEAIKHFPQHLDYQTSVKFQMLVFLLTSKRKTSGDHFLLRGAEKKETVINNKLRALCSYLANNDKKNAIKEFEQLCLVCCERRMAPTGNKYASDTEAAKWLINKFSKRKEFCTLIEVRNENELRMKVNEIIGQGNSKVISQNVSFKEQYAKVLTAVVSNLQKTPRM